MGIIDKVKEIKSKLINNGFIIDAIFSSVAKGVRNYNDIDLLYYFNTAKKYILKGIIYVWYITDILSD